MFKGLITAPTNGYYMLTLQDAWNQAITLCYPLNYQQRNAYNSEIHKTHTKETRTSRHPSLYTYINALDFQE